MIDDLPSKKATNTEVCQTKEERQKKKREVEKKMRPEETKADPKNEAKEQIVKDYKDNKRFVPLLWFCVIL